MKKLVVCGALAAIAGLPVCSAAEAPPAPAPSAYIQVTLASAYNWRGQVYDDRPVVQPYAQVTSRGFTFGVWANANLSGKNYGDLDVTEVDLTASYALRVDAALIALGVTYYLPVSTAISPYHEVFVTARYPNSWVTPRLEAFRTFDPSVGYYLLAGLTREFPLGEKFALSCDLSSGFGSGKYNRFSFEVDGARMNDGNAGLSLRYAISDAVSVTPSVRYTWLWDSRIKAASAAVYPASRPDPDMLIAGLSLDYAF